MMIHKRLIGEVSESKKYIAGNVLLQWCSLIANIVIMTSIAELLAGLFTATAEQRTVYTTVAVVVCSVAVRFFCAVGSARMGYLSSKAVKKILREKIYQKLLRLGASYKERVQTSEVVQVTVEGVEQLETYFGAYLPQFFYAMLAPLTLFIYLSSVNFPAAVVLLLCVPLIPVAIAAVQTWAKKLLAKYWGQYTALGDTFLENLQGLTTLKIYQADDFKNQEMNEQAERFRKITMKVLSMQLNSITIMDLIAYGGAALGVILAVTQHRAGNVTLAGTFLIILLSADFFIPMRQLGSFFHIAMNGMAASDKIFRLLDLPEEGAAGADYGTPVAGERGSAEKLDEKAHGRRKKEISEDCNIACRNVSFAYEPRREILQGVDMHFPQGSYTAIVGESGCGKSTLAAILMGRNKGYAGEITIGGICLTDIAEDSLMKHLTYISHQSYLFKGTVRENLLMGNPEAEEVQLWRVLEQVKIADFLRSEQGLDTLLLEKASNLSGGQCQRLALARALLHDSPVYIFDEATSNIDVESENDIVALIHELAKKKTVIMISHRLANVVGADCIYVLDKGTVAEQGAHEKLLAVDGAYAKIWNAQQRLERFCKGGVQ